MADNVVVSAGTGTTVAADEVVDGILGTVKVQYVKIMDATLDGTTKAAVGANGLAADVKAIAAGTNIIGKFGIDQTTDGTTNKVAADMRLAGSAAATGAGASGATVLRTTLASDSPGIIATGSQASPSASYLSTVAAGDIASAASDSGNPVKVGGVGKTANPTAVTDGQRVNAIFDKLGKQIVVGAIRDLKGMQATTITSSTTETTIVTAVASTFLDLYGLVITNTSATVTKVTIKDSTAGTTRAVFEIPATETRGFMVPVDSALPQATVNTAWTATCGTSVASVEIAAYYVKNI